MQDGEKLQTTRVELPFWPSSTNNLSWSADNLIAVGGGDSLAILTPRLSTRGPNHLQWDSIVHQVNYFSIGDVPMPELLGFEHWSIGEELSLRHVTALDWSPPGLGKFGSCVLAVLHSNHVLTLWECVGRPQVKDDWTRCSIINKAIGKYYSDLHELSTPEEIAMQQVRCRVRAFAWLPPLQKDCDYGNIDLDDHVARGEHHLAVTTEGGDILILSVGSPYEILDPDMTGWTVSVVQRMSALPELASLVPNSQPPENTSIAFADSIVCSGATGDNRILIAHITQGQLFVQTLTVEVAKGETNFQVENEEMFQLHGHSDLIGPIKFLPGRSSLIVFGADRVHSVAVSGSNKILGEHLSHHLDGRWDQITGLAFTSSPDGRPFVNFTSQMSTTYSDTARLPTTLRDEFNDQEPQWLYTIRESKANFSASYDLAGNVQERTWGIASSPLGDCVATCISMLPSDSPAHVIHSDQWCHVAITSDWWKSNDHLPADGGRSASHDITAESLVLSLRRQMAHATEDGKEHLSRYGMVAQVISAWGLDDRGLDRLNQKQLLLSPQSQAPQIADQITRYIRTQVYFHPNMLPRRVETLISIATREQYAAPRSKETYQQLIAVVLSLTPYFETSTALSRNIFQAYQAIQLRLQVGAAYNEEPAFEEVCSVCGNGMAFESLRWSRCAQGHQFQRCSLTFLSILEPGKSKSCKVCNTQYLNEHTVPGFKKTEEMKHANDRERDAEADMIATLHFEPRLSLARLLFAACDRCIFCGGKFAG